MTAVAAVTVQLARCTKRDEAGALCWGVVAHHNPRALGVMPCGHDMRFAKVSLVTGDYDPTVACDASCTSAVGNICVCACGGKNHGMSWVFSTTLTNTHTEEGRAALLAEYRAWTADAARQTAIRRLIAKHANLAARTTARRAAARAEREAEWAARRAAREAREAEWAREREAREAAQKAEREATVATSEFIGTVGERITLTLTLQGVRTINGPYGRCHLHILQDENGNSVRYFMNVNNNSDASPFTYGDFGYYGSAQTVDSTPVQVLATIKRHDVYHDGKQTVLTKVVALPA